MPVTYNSNLPNFIKGLKNWQKGATEALAQFAGATVQQAIKDEIPPPKQGQWALRASRREMEGQGRLKEAIRVTSPEPVGGSQTSYRVRVYVDMSGEVGKYALIHEVGGTITSHAGGPAMTFPFPPNSDTYISRRIVRIRPKQYFAHGVKLGQEKFLQEAPVYDPRLRGSKYRSRTTGRFVKFPF